jgi:RNA polymerase sigma-70 factor (ECF subfamily)
MADFVLGIEIDSVEPRDQSSKFETDWLQVTRAIADGCNESFQLYYEAFFDLMFVEARRLISQDEHACLDVVQDAMMKAIRSIKPINDKAKLKAWSRAVVRSVAYDRLRKQVRDELRHSEVRDYFKNKTEESDLEVRAARLHWLEQQIREIDPDLRRMVRLRYRLGWSLSKIANRFGMKTGAVDGKLRRLTQQLKKRSESEFNEQD